MTSPFDRLINGIKYDGRVHYIESIIEGRGDQNRLITNDDQRLVCNCRDKVISGLWNTALMTNQHPAPGKNRVLFAGENLSRNKVILWQCFRPGPERLFGFMKAARASRLRSRLHHTDGPLHTRAGQ